VPEIIENIQLLREYTRWHPQCTLGFSPVAKIAAGMG
jgi:hypothetical protein